MMSTPGAAISGLSRSSFVGPHEVNGAAVGDHFGSDVLMFVCPVTFTAATETTPCPLEPEEVSNGPDSPSLPAAMTTTTPLETMREATNAQGLSENPSGLPILVVIISA